MCRKPHRARCVSQSQGLAEVASSPDETILPALALPTVVVFPGLVAPLLAESPTEISAIEAAAPQNLQLALFWSRQPDDFDEIAEVGVATRILRLVRQPAGQVQVLLQGVARVRKLSVIARDPVPRLSLQPVTAPKVAIAGNPLREAVLNSL